jgi:hypothetical protein
MHKRLIFITSSSFTAVAAALALAPVASAQSPGDPSAMTVQQSDFTSANLVGQGSQDSGGVTGYQRMFAGARVGNESLAMVLSLVLVAPNAATARQAFTAIAAQTVTDTGKQLAKRIAGRRGRVTVRLKVGATQSLQVGDQGVLTPIAVTATVRRLVRRRWVTKRTRFALDFAFVRQDVAIEIIAGLGAPGGGLGQAMGTLAGDAATHMKTGLAPSGYVAPTITAGAAPAPGATLTGVASPWTGSSTGESLTFAWQRCDANGLNCVAVPGAVGSAYTLTQADAGSTIRVEVTYTNIDRTGAPSVSLPTAVVAS